jgi:hypothetical protein
MWLQENVPLQLPLSENLMSDKSFSHSWAQNSKSVPNQ